MNPYTQMDHLELVRAFYQANGENPVASRELSLRIFKHAEQAGYAGDPATDPLMGRDGNQVQDPDTGAYLMNADYVSYAVKHHRHALEGIVGFLFTQPGDDDYNTGAAIILGRTSTAQRS